MIGRVTAVAFCLTLMASLASGASIPQAKNVLAQQPLRFEPNRGQTDRQVRFVSRGQGYVLFLTDRSAVLALNDGKGEKAVTTTFVNGHANASTGEELLPGISNYLGGKPAIRGVPGYGRARLENMYPGVDLVFYGRQRQLEYDLEVAAGADLDQVQLKVGGADRVAIAANGDLVLTVNGKTLRWLKPVATQQGREIAATYVRAGPDRFAFRLGAYDHSKPLRIDPTLSYATYLGDTNQDDSAYGLASDAQGNVYMVGYTSSANFPTTPGAYDRSLEATPETFLLKFSPQNQLVYSTFLGGAPRSTIAVDSQGNAYLAGITEASPITPPFQPTANAFETTSPGLPTGVEKISADGSQIVYATYLGNSEGAEDDITSIAVDSSGNAYVTGWTRSAKWPTTAGSYMPSVTLKPETCTGSCPSDYSYAFLSKLNTDGSALVYSTYLGDPSYPAGGQDIIGNSIRVDDAGNAYVAGGGAVVPTAGAYGPASPTDRHAFVVKMNPTGSAPIYAANLPTAKSSGFEGITTSGLRGLAVDSNGNAYITGAAGPGFPMVNAAQATFAGQYKDGFVAKLNSAGSALLFSTYLGGTKDDWGNAIELDSQNNVIVAGMTMSSDFPRERELPNTSFTGTPHDFVARYSNSGQLQFSTFMSGNFGGFTPSLATAGATAAVAFATYSNDLPTTPDALDSVGDTEPSSDVYFAKIDLSDVAATCDVPGSQGINVCSPTDGSTDTSPIHVSAAFNLPGTPYRFELWNAATAQKLVTVRDSNLMQADITLQAGDYTLAFVAKDTLGNRVEKQVHITVGSGGTSGCAAPSTNGINVCAPSDGATVASPVHVSAAFTLPAAPYRFELWNGSNKLVSASNTNVMDADITLQAGSYTLTFVARDTAGNRTEKQIQITVGSGSGGMCPAPSSNDINVCEPVDNATVTSPVNVSAGATVTGGVYRFELWVDGAKALTVRDSGQMQAAVPMSAGNHTLEFVAQNAAGLHVQTSRYITVSGACAPPSSPGVVVCQPQEGTTVSTSFPVEAYANVTGGVYRFELWANGTKFLTVRDSGTMNQTVTLPAGSYRLDFVAQNSDGSDREVQTIYIFVQ